MDVARRLVVGERLGFVHDRGEAQTREGIVVFAPLRLAASLLPLLLLAGIGFTLQ